MRDLHRRLGKLEADDSDRLPAPHVVIRCGPHTVERPRPWRGEGIAYIRDGDPVPGQVPAGRSVIILPGKVPLVDGEDDADA